MRFIRLGLLTLLLSVLLVAAIAGGYGRDRQVIRWFPGSGIAAKIDVWGPSPQIIRVVNQATGDVASVEVWPDGSFVAPLKPGIYRLLLQGDSRTVSVGVPAGECVDLILDYRIPGLVLQVPG